MLNKCIVCINHCNIRKYPTYRITIVIFLTNCGTFLKANLTNARALNLRFQLQLSIFSCCKNPSYSNIYPFTWHNNASMSYYIVRCVGEVTGNYWVQATLKEAMQGNFACAELSGMLLRSKNIRCEYYSINCCNLK